MASTPRDQAWESHPLGRCPPTVGSKNQVHPSRVQGRLSPSSAILPRRWHCSQYGEAPAGHTCPTSKSAMGLPTSRNYVDKYLPMEEATSRRSRLGWSTRLGDSRRTQSDSGAYMAIHKSRPEMLYIPHQWVMQPLREAAPFGQAPRFLVRDRDQKAVRLTRAATGGKIEILKTPYRTTESQRDLRKILE